MTLWRYSSGGKTQSGEDRIGGGAVGLSIDPFEHAFEAQSGLVNVVAVGDVDDGFEQLLQAFSAIRRFREPRRSAGAATRRAQLRPHSLVLTHPSAFPRDCSAATQIPPVAG